MYTIETLRTPDEEKMFVTVQKGKTCICRNAVYRTNGTSETSELNTVAVLTSEKAGEVATIIGIYLKEGDTHYVEGPPRYRLVQIIRDLGL